MDTTKKVEKSEVDWKKELTPEQYQVLRQCGTEPPFSGKYVHVNDKGMYTCAACGNELFSSEAKFSAQGGPSSGWDSGSGWPSFYASVAPDRVELREDRSHGMVRTEVRCAKCGGHLGHVFDDGPQTLPDGRQATGQRFCINSTALKLNKK